MFYVAFSDKEASVDKRGGLDKRATVDKRVTVDKRATVNKGRARRVELQGLEVPRRILKGMQIACRILWKVLPGAGPTSPGSTSNLLGMPLLTISKAIVCPS